MSSTPARSQKELVRDHFTAKADAWKAVYSTRDLPSLLIQERAEKVMEYVDSLALPKGARALDLGCGAGLVSRQLVERGFHVIGIDVAESMLELARASCAAAGPGQAVFRIGDVENLDLPEGSFDLVIAMGLIEYLEWDRWALQQMHRVLRIGGHLVVTVPNLLRLSHLDPWYLLVQVKRLFRKRMQKWFGKSPLPRSVYFDRYYVLPRLRRQLEALGFVVESSYSHGYGPFWTLQRFRRLSLWIHELFSKLSRLAPFRGEFGSDVVILCRAVPSLFGVDPLRPFPDPVPYQRAFESRRKRLVQIRETWLGQHSVYRNPAAEPLQTEAMKDVCVVVLAPHPDDEVIGCGGTLLKLVRAGAHVTVIHATDGSSSVALADLPEEVRTTVRIEHAREVGKAAGFDEIIFWKRKEGSELLAEECVKDLVQALERIRPQIIFVPFLTDIHPDHAAMNRILVQALERSASATESVLVLSYEVWALCPNNRFCDVLDVMKEKERLLWMYRTEMGPDDYVHGCAALHYYNSLRLTGKKGFVEGFLAQGAREYIGVARASMD